MDIFERLTRFVRSVFKTTLDIFLDALALSPNAQGYVGGSVTELLLKKKLEDEYRLEVLRIREKWEGKKHPRHHGDFYFREGPGSPWFVIESKGVKSNSEKWHRLFNYDRLKAFLVEHAKMLPTMDLNGSVEGQVDNWIDNNLPLFKTDFATNLYDFEEVQAYRRMRTTVKADAIKALKGLTRDEVNARIDNRLRYIMTRLRVLETHFVSGRSASSERTQATPRKDEFNIVALDIVLRYDEHKFLFANPQNLDSSASDANHLQQNYIVGLVTTDTQGQTSFSVNDDWTENFRDVYGTLDASAAVAEQDMQVDTRYAVPQEPENPMLR